MADGAYRWLGNAPEPDAARVAGIDAAWDDAQAHAFAEPARIAAVERIERALSTARNADLEAVAARLSETRSLLAGLDPHTLEPRRGLAGLFDSRSKRLKRFRETWRRATDALTDAVADLSGRIEGWDRRSGALDGVWAEIRDAVTELDAHLAVAARRLTGQALAEDGPHPLEARRAVLDACRAAALQSLPLIRAAQNADARAAGTLKACVDGVAAWRADWQGALGLAGKRPKKVRPDPAQLIRSRDDLLAVTERALVALSAARARHTEIGGRMTALSTALEP
ncbi:MAG: hypothetical protein ACXW3O_06380 [Brevundimonas sp.]